MELPDVSHIAPVDIAPNQVRTPLMELTIINEYTKYQTLVGYWNDIDKCFYRTDGERIKDEVVKTNPL